MKLLVRLSLVFAFIAGLAQAASAVVPLADFFRDVDFDEITVSPDGSKVAALSTWKGQLNLYVIDVKTKQPRMLTGLTTMSVAGVHWIGNDRLIFTSRKDGYATGGLFAIDADGKNSRALGESVEQQGQKGGRIFRSTEYLDRFGTSTDEILVTNNQRRMEEPDVYRLNIRTGIKHRVATNPGDVQLWVADRAGIVRLGYGERDRARFLVYRDDDRGEFREIKRWDFSDGEFTPLAFDETNGRVYVRSNLGRDTAQIVLFDLKTQAVVKELFHNDTYDVEQPVLDPETGGLLGFFLETEVPTIVWTDDNLKKLQALVDESLPDTRNFFSSRSRDRRWIVIRAATDRDPGAYYLLNTRDLTMEKLVSRAGWLNPAQMSPVQPIQYQARDGLTIHGYLTLPAAGPAKNLPLIVHPHGGPWARDTGGFDPGVQFLASRGYAVLQMNFRGSTGYGRKLLEAGYGQWGLAMQDDITDGVRWAIAQGIADPHRIAIYGASYGGYATMAGLAFTPELYRCGVNYVGVTDIALLLRTMPDAWERARSQLEAMTGNAKRDRERLEATSPLRNVDKITAPVFFAYGRLDERVDIKHGTKMATALRKRGIPVVWMERDDEGHGYRRRENKEAFYAELEKFFAQYLAP